MGLLRCCSIESKSFKMVEGSYGVRICESYRGYICYIGGVGIDL
jgi:hypothetical protein